MPKKHFLCTHHFVSDEARDQHFENCKNLTSKHQFARAKSEHAEGVQHWIGSADFWLCYWIADRDEAIFDLLDKLGSSEFFTTLPAEMDFFASKYNEVDDIYGVNSFVEQFLYSFEIAKNQQMLERVGKPIVYKP